MDNTPDDLIRSVYPQLRDLAGFLISRERTNHTLQRTALVSEFFLRIAEEYKVADMTQEKLLAVAAHRMRQILVEYGRRHRAQKRGNGQVTVSLSEIDVGTESDPDTLLALDQALERLERLDLRAVKVVELKFFAGFTNSETGAVLGVSDGTVERDWTHARAWLYRELNTVEHS